MQILAVHESSVQGSPSSQSVGPVQVTTDCDIRPMPSGTVQPVIQTRISAAASRGNAFDITLLNGRRPQCLNARLMGGVRFLGVDPDCQSGRASADPAGRVFADAFGSAVASGRPRRRDVHDHSPSASAARARLWLLRRPPKWTWQRQRDREIPSRQRPTTQTVVSPVPQADVQMARIHPP